MNKNNRKGGMATIIITIVLILTVLVSIPMWKSISNSNSNSMKGSINIINDSSTTVHNFVNNNKGGSTELPFK